MKEINEAYDEIVNMRKGSSSSAGSSNNSARPEYAHIRTLISNNMLDEAQKKLDEFPTNARDAEWYFLNGTVLYRRGWLDNAYTSFATACRMDPTNPEYRNALNRAQGKAGATGYNPYRSYGGGSACD